MSISSGAIGFKRGETQTIAVRFITSASYTGNESSPTSWVAVDISDYTVQLVAKLTPAQADTAFYIDKTNAPGDHSDPTNGRTSFTLSSTDTLGFPVSSKSATYFAQAWCKDGNGNIKATNTFCLTVFSSLVQEPTI